MASKQRRVASSAVRRAWLLKFLRGETGVAALEFAILAPLLLLVLLAAIELGAAVSSRMAVNASISSASKSILLSNTTGFDGDTAKDLAEGLKAESNVEFVEININNTYIAEANQDGVTLTSAANENLCFCPAISNDEFQWGEPVECGDTCPSSVLAGSYVYIEVEFSSPILLGKFLPETFLGKISTVIKTR